MKLILITILKTQTFVIVLFLSETICGQINLVNNPSFEDIIACPYQLAQINDAIGWYSVRPSPDYFNSCASISSDVSIPFNVFGYHYASSGDAYAGFWARNANNYREYLGSQLISPLQIGTKYFVSIKVSLSPNPVYSEYCGVNKFGVLFSTINYSDSNLAPQNNYAQIYANTIITDTLNWVTVKGSFIADSTFSFINIGNFFSDSLTDSIQIAGTVCQAYYYLDDICVSTDSAYAYNYTYVGIKENINQPAISVYPNPADNYLNINSKFINEQYDLVIYDMLGREVFLKRDVISRIEHIPLEDINSAVLFIQITHMNQTFNYKVLKLKQ